MFSLAAGQEVYDICDEGVWNDFLLLFSSPWWRVCDVTCAHYSLTPYVLNSVWEHMTISPYDDVFVLL